VSATRLSAAWPKPPFWPTKHSDLATDLEFGSVPSQKKPGEPSRLLIRSASNAYFPQTISVISLPERDEAVRRAIDAVWSYVEAVETIDDLKYERKKSAVKGGLEGVSDEEAFAEIQGRRLGSPKTDKPVKVAELETLLASKEEVGEDRPEGIFHARTLPRSI